MSTDPAHSLADVLETELPGHEPVEVAPNLFAHQASAQRELERQWGAVQQWAGQVLRDRGADRISADELTVPPGADELFSLLRLRAHDRDPRFDAVVVDCAPTGETLRLLSFPDVARWWLERVLPLAAQARPLAKTLLDLPIPEPAVLDDVERLVRNMVDMAELLRDRSRVSLRLVMTPDRMVVDEARRTFTYLNLYGFLTDAVVVNRVLPAEAGAYFGAWRERQLEVLDDVRAAFAPVPVLPAPFFGEEVVGARMLDRLGDAVYAERDAGGVLHDRLAEELTLGDGEATLRLDVPFAEKGDIALQRVGVDLVVRVGEHKRTLLLPPALHDYAPAGAAFEDGALQITLHAPGR
jgi:arsenite/tail-anchored protein-transporting ATPase